jgi:hypothetical protein
MERGAVSRMAFPAFLPAMVFSVFSFVFFALVTVAPPAVGETTVVFAPGTSEAEAWQRVVSSGGYVVSSTTLSNVVIAYAAEQTFASQLFLNGALSFAAAPGLCFALIAQEDDK